MSKATGERRRQAILDKLFSFPIPKDAQLHIVAAAVAGVAANKEQAEILAELRDIYEEAQPAITEIWGDD